MCLGEIDDVDVVAYARAVRCVVVVAEDLRLLAGGKCLECDRDQIQDGGVAQLAPAGPGDVEVPQSRPAKAPRLSGVAAQPFADQLGAAVRADRAADHVLVERGIVGLVGDAVCRGGRREHQLVDPCGLHRHQQVGEAADVLAVVPGGTGRGLADLLLRRDMHHRLDGVLVHHRDELLGGIVGGDVDLHEGRITYPVRDPGAQVVDDDRVASLPEQAHDVGADIAGAAGHQDGHGHSLMVSHESLIRYFACFVWLLSPLDGGARRTNSNRVPCRTEPRLLRPPRGGAGDGAGSVRGAGTSQPTDARDGSGAFTLSGYWATAPDGVGVTDGLPKGSPAVATVR